ncbi:MAG TPA: sorbosone dehydrogenase family protein, partial [Usitatibacter sp.]|nr:sorbosone dehydrogenase family protein [Usitatibacter sp.]
MKLAASALALSLAASCAAQARIELERLKLPPGFEVSVFAENVPGARSMALGDKGTLFLGTIGEGRVYAIANDGKKATKVVTIARGLNMPNGVAV